MDNLKRKLFLKQELKRVILKSIIKNASLPLTYRYFAYYQNLKTRR